MKRLITLFLLFFVSSAMLTLVARSFREQEENTVPDGVSLLFFHARGRCPKCIHLEKRLRKLFDETLRTETETGKTGLLVIPYDAPENREIAERFHIGTISLVLIDQQHGKVVRYRDFSGDIWNSNEDEMFDDLSKKIDEFLSNSIDHEDVYW